MLDSRRCKKGDSTELDDDGAQSMREEARKGPGLLTWVTHRTMTSLTKIGTLKYCGLQFRHADFEDLQGHHCHKQYLPRALPVPIRSRQPGRS